ncbi:MAG: hypothetical protein ACTSPY_09575 [Candidatus Helarchaeota archaeon]
MDKRFEEINNQMDKRFEEINNQMDKRFEEINKRFNSTDRRLDKIENVLYNIQSSIGKPFEQFARNVVIDILKAEGIEEIDITSKKIPDPEGIVHPDTKEIEIDGFSFTPPIVVEITSILRELEKIEIFIKKKHFIEKLYGKEFRGFFVAAGSELTPEKKAKAKILCHKNNIDFINL